MDPTSEEQQDYGENDCELISEDNAILNEHCSAVYNTDALNDVQCMTIYALRQWLDPDDADNMMISVAILLFSGIIKKNQAQLHMINNENTLEFTVKMPEAFTSVDQVHEKWLTERGVKKLDSYHPMLTGLKQFTRVS